MKNTQRGSTLLPVLIAILLIGGGTYMYTQNKQRNQSEVVNQTTNTAKVVVAKDELSDWQMLKNNDLGIEIKFPNDYRSNTVNSKLVDTSELVIYSIPQPIEFGPRLIISRNSNYVTSDTNVDTYAESIFSNDKSKSVEERGSTTINGTKWLKVKYLDVSGVGPEMTYTNYFAIKNGYMYRVGYNNTSQVNNYLFEKIIETITFL